MITRPSANVPRVSKLIHCQMLNVLLSRVVPLIRAILLQFVLLVLPVVPYVNVHPIMSVTPTVPVVKKKVNVKVTKIVRFTLFVKIIVALILARTLAARTLFVRSLTVSLFADAFTNLYPRLKEYKMVVSEMPTIAQSMLNVKTVSVWKDNVELYAVLPMIVPMAKNVSTVNAPFPVFHTPNAKPILHASTASACWVAEAAEIVNRINPALTTNAKVH